MRFRLNRLALGGLAVGTMLTLVPSAHAANTTEVVTDADVAEQPENTPPTDNWVEYRRNAGDATWVAGPETPPAGNGSLQLSTPTGADKVTVFNFDWNGTDLDAVTAVGYSTYRAGGQTAAANQVPALNLQVDVNGAAPGGFTTLVYEPVYNGTVVTDEWQTWNAIGGTWWSSNPIPGAPNRDTFVSFDTIRTANPDAVIAGGVGINQGSGNGGLTGNADAFIFGTAASTVTYNFEVIRDLDGDGIPDTAPPTSKDQCKKDGYKAFNNPSFKNQGECVSYVNHA